MQLLLADHYDISRTQRVNPAVNDIIACSLFMIINLQIIMVMQGIIDL